MCACMGAASGTGRISVAQTLIHQIKFHSVLSESTVLIQCKDIPSHRVYNFSLKYRA